MCKTPKGTEVNLRIPAVKRSSQVTITVDGEQKTAYEGESVHAALIASGILNLRETGKGEKRGVFCGMGICYECLVAIDDLPEQRACMTPVVAGMEIATSEE